MVTEYVPNERNHAPRQLVPTNRTRSQEKEYSMSKRARWIPILGLALVLVLGTACASKSGLELTHQEVAVVQAELTQAQSDLATAAQQVAALTDSLAKARQDRKSVV